MSEESSSESIREIRINPIVPSESVLVATARGMRPKQREAPPARECVDHVPTCPFCRGNEHLTPPALYVDPDPRAWRIRIVENLYPVLGDDRRRHDLSLGLQQTIDGYGRHEVIVDHERHGIAMHEMDIAHIAALFGAYQQRMRELYQSNAHLRYVLVFKNFGAAAGASLNHTHSQIIGMPVVPHNVQAEVDHSRSYYRKHHHCIFCALIDEALTFEATIYDRVSGAIRRRIEVGQYVIERGARFIAIKPFASRYEWEIQILPLVHSADYLDASEADLEDLARVLQRAMMRLHAVLGEVQFNYFLHGIPHSADADDCRPSYHWHLEICPRTTIPSGFELGSGLFVNTVSPEDAAARLRAALGPSVPPPPDAQA
ncbi:MAG: galactose-1-phosphate uridylyltransferase [Acidiferrobacteraceae bacterium]